MIHTMKKSEWILRVAIFGEFFGHGIFALQGKQTWVAWITQLTGANATLAAKLLALIGILDILAALIILVRPIPAVLAWAAFWGFWTALVRPIIGEPVWDFVERWANWGAPLALFFLRGSPRRLREWWR